ncbi:MAG TPA: serine hydrolase [Steroidobacteraceae bacterium]|nr:serine hydrolase [Steroidobacteraceae bacterium]
MSIRKPPSPRADRTRPAALVLAAAFVVCATSAVHAGEAGAPPDLDRYVAKAMRAFGAPGLSLAIVQDGRTVIAKGYGVRSIATRDPVTPDTAFPIGSETKAFTSAALAILVDEGRLRWSDRIADKLRGFRMYDPYATEHMTVRDLLTHRSGLGLGEGDLLITPNTTRSRADIVHALRYLKPRTGFREVFAYDNILYIVAGQLVQSVSGETWEHFVEHHIFAPLGMMNSRTLYDPAAPNAVALHGRIDGSIRGMGKERILTDVFASEASAPCGAINASAVDMAKWMAMWEEGGKLPDGRILLSAAAVRELRDPVVVVPSDAFDAVSPLLAGPALQDYALGWFVEDDYGHTVVEHMGAVFGAQAALYFIPDRGVAFSVMINSEDGGARRAVVDYLLAHYLGQPRQDWVGELAAVDRDIIGKTLSVMKNLPRRYEPNDRVSLRMPAYAGAYSDPWYGPMTVSVRPGNHLWINFIRTPKMDGPLEHIADDTFRAHWTDRGIEDAYLSFEIAGGRIRSIAMRPVSPLADFSFDYQDLHFRPVGG